MTKEPQDNTSLPPCKHCRSTNVSRCGVTKKHGFQRYKCKDCGRESRPDSPYKQGGNNKLDDGLTLGQRRNKWKKQNREQCTERDRKRRQERVKERKEAKEKDSAD